jgi:hypothetical protein
VQMPEGVLKGATTKILAFTDAEVAKHTSPLCASTPPSSTTPASSATLGVTSSLVPKQTLAKLHHVPAGSPASDGGSTNLEDLQGVKDVRAGEPDSARSVTSRRTFFCRTSSSAYSAAPDETENQWCHFDNTLYGDDLR